MAVNKRARKKPETNIASSLLSSLRFISLAQKKEGLTYQTHCRIENNYIVATDGTLSIGCKIEEDLTACPHTLSLTAALSKCGQELSITHLDNGRMSIKSGAFRALVPCAQATELIGVSPDPPAASVDSRLLKAFEVCGPLATEGAQAVELASVLMRSGSVLAANGYVLIEYWHGIDTPVVAFPKVGLAAVLKSGKQLSKFGCSHNSLTFHFEDESWIKTQVFDEEWPDLSEIIDVPTNAWPIPEKLWEAIDAVSPFSADKSVYFAGRCLRSHADEHTGAQYELDGIPDGPCYSAEYLKTIQPYAERIDFTTDDCKAYFFSENVRGVVMGRATNKTPSPLSEKWLNEKEILFNREEDKTPF